MKMNRTISISLVAVAALLGTENKLSSQIDESADPIVGEACFNLGLFSDCSAGVNGTLRENPNHDDGCEAQQPYCWVITDYAPGTYVCIICQFTQPGDGIQDGCKCSWFPDQNGQQPGVGVTITWGECQSEGYGDYSGDCFCNTSPNGIPNQPGQEWFVDCGNPLT
jgi:hypothetical protein